MLDAEDHDWASEHGWHLMLVDRGGYAVRKEGPDNARRSVLLHREVAGLEYGDPRQVDHINRDKLDNRRCNLRIVSPDAQKQNIPAVGRSRFRGVCRTHCKSAPWKARVKMNGRVHELGYFATEEEAGEVATAFRAEHMPYATD